jgi:uncharacterized protein YndB with AHSA1/START domain
MPSATWTVTVQRPQAEVFDYLANVANHGEWSPKPWRQEGFAPPLAVGSKFNSIGVIPGDKEHRGEVECTAYEPPSRFVLVAHEGDGEFVNTYVLSPEGSGTKVEKTLDMPKPPGVIGFLFPVILATYIKPQVQKGMNQLKQRLESKGDAA